MKVLQVCAELFPLLKTGGLADVCGALPAALRARGCEVRVLLPAFPAVKRGVADVRPLAEGLPGHLPLPGTRLLQGRLPDGTPCVLVDHPAYEREGNPYAGADGLAYADNHLRFAMLGSAAAMLADGLDASWKPQVVHGHDWHAGLAPAYLQETSARRGVRLAGSVYTVHNLAFQGLFPLGVVPELGLPGDFFHVQGLEFHGQVSFMKAGLVYADKVTTVSPTYAQEIQGEEQGCGMDGVTRARAHDLSGILNGVDPAVWNPATDSHIAAHYSARDMAGKARCRTALQAEFGLGDQTAAPLFGVVSRLTEQKGMNLVLAGLPDLLQRGAQLVVLGSGDAALETALRAAATQHPEQVALRLGYDEALAHRIVAGADVIMVPSRFEPCGLTQLYGLAYGSLPLVRRVGGLADTVVDATLESLDDDLATGMVFDRFERADFVSALRRAIALYRRTADWRLVQARAMAQHFDWDAAAARYLALYERVATPV
ncbi:glycogen synthase [Rubrivivax sp. A210]|uniref:glycogen synthase GlgA n=1 Tax=Rubrivivax sp. A210 TaxID=2772301 RepID=UPI001919A49F|nr:glycogen synthase GlgA [Rubrivivax sp. A210]CAD5366224.1 glycogen synthase [Rubrivivax sp. A210]